MEKATEDVKELTLDYYAETIMLKVRSLEVINMQFLNGGRTKRITGYTADIKVTLTSPSIKPLTVVVTFTVPHSMRKDLKLKKLRNAIEQKVSQVLREQGEGRTVIVSRLFAWDAIKRTIEHSAYLSELSEEGTQGLELPPNSGTAPAPDRASKGS